MTATYGSLRIASHVLLPEIHEIASIDRYENRLRNQISPRGTSTEPKYAEGVSKLLAAESDVIGLFPKYDQQLAQEAAETLIEAYEETSDEILKAERAFFIAKAYLMQDNRGEARIWLDDIRTLKVAAFQADALALIQDLEALDEK